MCAEQAENPVAGLGRYELRHLVPHLAAAGNASDLHRLLRVDWEDPAGTPSAQNAWYVARARAGDLSGYVADVGLGWRLAEEDSNLETHCGGPTTSIGLEVRYALLTASVRSRAHGVPPSLMLVLVEKRLSSLGQALEHAHQCRGLRSAPKRCGC